MPLRRCRHKIGEFTEWVQTVNRSCLSIFKKEMSLNDEQLLVMQKTFRVD